MKKLQENVWFRQSGGESYTGTLYAGEYRNGKSLALKLIDDQEGECIAVCTVNLPEVPLHPGEIILKDYSENEGMLHSLFSQGIVSSPVRYAKNGHVTVPIVNLLIPIQA